jgi:uncharacterized protein involved in exopolysaccharide biosynthesis
MNAGSARDERCHIPAALALILSGDVMDDFVDRPRQTASHERDDSELELSLSDIVVFLWGYRWLIGACVSVGAALAVLYVLMATPIYTAKAQILIESRLPQTLKEYASETIATLDTPAVESQIAIIMSEKIAEKVVRKAGFLDAPEQEENVISLNPLNWVRGLISMLRGDDAAKLSADEEKSRLRDAMEYLWGGMHVGRLGLSHVIEISYNSASREQAAEVANHIADAYIEDQIETRAEAARQGTIWLEARIESLRQQMNEAAFKVKEFKARRDYRFPQNVAQPGEAETKKASEPADERATAITMEDLETQAATYRKIYESYLQAYTESVQTQSYPVTNTRIITRARHPNSRSWPRGSKVLVIAVALGGMAGIGLALLHYSFTRSRLSRRR